MDFAETNLIKRDLMEGERVLYLMQIGNRKNPRYRGFEAIVQRRVENKSKHPIDRYWIKVSINGTDKFTVATRGQIRPIK